MEKTRCNFVISLELLNKLKERAKSKDLTISQLLRQLIKKELSK